MTKYYFEDFTPGWTFENGPRTLTAQEIVAFAREWDPQAFHTDEDKARASPYGGLIASGWHTGVVAMRKAEGERLVGIITRSDLLEALVALVEGAPGAAKTDRGR